MKIVQYCNYNFPPKGYAGVERIVSYLSQGLVELGHEVFLKCNPGSTHRFAKVITSLDQLPSSIDVVHFHRFSEIYELQERKLAWAFTHHGVNDDSVIIKKVPGIRMNTIFVSRRHAEMHNSDKFVLNGLDSHDYPPENMKEDYYFWVGALSWGERKGLFTTLRIAKETGIRLKIAGPGPENLEAVIQASKECPNIEYLGVVDGKQKLELLGRAKALIFPINWEDPCPLVPIEAMFCGTPVITKNIGAMSELIDADTGIFCEQYEDILEALNRIHKFDPGTIRQKAIDKFNHIRCASSYLEMYKRIECERKNTKVSASYLGLPTSFWLSPRGIQMNNTFQPYIQKINRVANKLSSRGS